MITFTYLHEEDNVVLTAGTKTPDLRREAALCGCEYKLCSSAVDSQTRFHPVSLSVDRRQEAGVRW